MSLIQQIEEQFAIGFTGRINILGEERNQYIGAILIKEGAIIKCNYQDMEGKKALLHLIVADVTSQENFQIIVEPEIVHRNKGEKVLDIEQAKQKASEIVQKFAQTWKFRPPSHLKLLADVNFLSQGENPSTEEFRVLCTLTEYPQVKDTYKAVELHEYEAACALVSLRKKKAVRVFNEGENR